MLVSLYLTSSYPYVHVLRVLVDIPASSHLDILRFMYSSCLFLSLHPHILISLGSCALRLHPFILIFLGWRVLACNLVSSHHLSLGSSVLSACWYPCISHPHILMFMYFGCLLISPHPHILISLGSCTPAACFYPCILTSSYP